MVSSHPFVRAFSARRLHLSLLVSLVLGLVSTACTEQTGEPSSAMPAPYSAALKGERTPIAFEPNLKQADARYKFLVHQNGLTMGFLANGVEVSLATKS